MDGSLGRLLGEAGVFEDEKDEDGASLFIAGEASVQPVDVDPARESITERRLSET